VLYYELFTEKHDFKAGSSKMNSRLSELLDGVNVAREDDHQ